MEKSNVFLKCTLLIIQRSHMRGWMTRDFTSLLAVFHSYQEEADNKRLCAMKSRLWLERVPTPAGLD